MRLVIIGGTETGRQIEIGAEELYIGRSSGVGLTLEGANVSRRHSRLWLEQGRLHIEDLGSSNGTFVNRQRISGRVALEANDLISVGSHLLRLEDDQDLGYEVTIQRQTLADATNPDLFRANSAQKLQSILELAHRLSGLLNTDDVLNRLIEHLLVVFPQASRALVILPTPQGPSIRAVEERRPTPLGKSAFSRTLTTQVLTQGKAILAGDTREAPVNATITTLGIQSLMAAPLSTRSRKAAGMIELDRFDRGTPFTEEDLYLFTSIALQVSNVLENANLHLQLLETQRIQQEIALAREIQQGFLPQEPLTLAGGRFELVGRLIPAYEISGDFYDYFAIDDRHFAAIVADVSGKGMPAALFMTMVRALVRQLAETVASPAQILSRLNDALARDNPKFMFVTVILAIYDVVTGECALARGGHPPAVLRNARGRVSEVTMPTGTLVGIMAPYPAQEDVRMQLGVGDTLVFYTDGVTEANAQDSPELFGSIRLESLIARLPSGARLEDWVQSIRDEVQRFSKSDTFQDDVTLLLLRRLGCG
jgi:serine phosphatase RsbU (regulator of sigma subunit)